jgi:hypothetical protein
VIDFYISLCETQKANPLWTTLTPEGVLTAQEFMLMFVEKEKKSILRVTGFGSRSRASNPEG